jgi:hypothetical protein
MANEMENKYGKEKCLDTQEYFDAKFDKKYLDVQLT